MFIPEVAPSDDTITPWKVSTHCVYTRGSVLMRITVRKARWPMLSDAAVLLQKGHVDAHGKDIHRGSSVKEGKKDCFLYIHHIQPSVRNLPVIALNTTSLEEWYRLKYLQSPGHHKPRCCWMYYRKGGERSDRALANWKYCLWDLAQNRESQMGSPRDLNCDHMESEHGYHLALQAWS